MYEAMEQETEITLTVRVAVRMALENGRPVVAGAEVKRIEGMAPSAAEIAERITAKVGH